MTSRRDVASKTVWTDYPFAELGDTPGEPAPIRPARLLSYDGNKYCQLVVCGRRVECKYCYVYRTPGRCDDGRTRHVPLTWLVAVERP